MVSLSIAHNGSVDIRSGNNKLKLHYSNTCGVQTLEDIDYIGVNCNIRVPGGMRYRLQHVRCFIELWIKSFSVTLQVVSIYEDTSGYVYALRLCT